MPFLNTLDSLRRRALLLASLLASRVLVFANTERDADGLPIPPRHLIFLVSGAPDIEWFLASGKLGALALRDVLHNNNIDIASFETVLDFGCGIGRVLRHLPQLTPAKLHGCDYNSKLIAWCEKNLPLAKFSVNRLTGGLSYEDGSFDFVFALSVFTHLTEAQHKFWIDELHRILRPGGFLFLTTHGKSYERQIPENLRDHFRSGQLVVLRVGRAGENRCAAFHPEKYVRDQLACGWQVVDFVEQGAAGNPTQDVYLLRKPV